MVGSFVVGLDFPSFLVLCTFLILLGSDGRSSSIEIGFLPLPFLSLH